MEERAMESYIVVRLGRSDKEAHLVDTVDGDIPNEFFGATLKEWQLDDLSAYGWDFLAVLQPGEHIGNHKQVSTFPLLLLRRRADYVVDTTEAEDSDIEAPVTLRG